MNQITIQGQGNENTFVTFTGTGTPALNWQGATNGGGLKDIQIIIKSNAVDAVNVNGIAQFVMRNVLLIGPYAGSGGAAGCFADNGKGCGLHITAGTVASFFEHINAFEFAGDGINIDATSSGTNIFRTVYGQGDGGTCWDIHVGAVQSSGGPIYCYDCEALGVANFSTVGNWLITAGVLQTNQNFAFLGYGTVSDGNSGSASYGMDFHLVDFVWLSNPWIKSLGNAATSYALMLDGVQNVFIEGGFIQSGSASTSPIEVSSISSGISLLGTIIGKTGSQTAAIHYGGGGAGNGNSALGSMYGGLTLTDDFLNSGFNTGTTGSLTTVGGLSNPSGLCNSTSNVGGWQTIVDNNAACAYGGTPTGGGTTKCPVYCDGTSWKIH
jgi:hypothetical protein